MTVIETILTGVIVSLLSIFVGKLWGEKGKLTEEQCMQRQKSCSTPLCHDLSAIREAQKEMKEDIKFIRNHMIENAG